MTKDSWRRRGGGMGGERDREREREIGVTGQEGGGGRSRQGSTCLTKDIGEASLLCQDAWSHQWPSKSPARWGRGRAHIHERGQQEGPVRTPQTQRTDVNTHTHTHNTHSGLHICFSTRSHRKLKIKRWSPCAFLWGLWRKKDAAQIIIHNTKDQYWLHHLNTVQYSQPHNSPFSHPGPSAFFLHFHSVF